MYEIIVGDLMKEFRMSLDQVLDSGFFEVMRLWGIQDEIKARDLNFLSNAIDLPYSDKDRRADFNRWIVSRQPRRNLPTSNIPTDVMEELLRKWNDG